MAMHATTLTDRAVLRLSGDGVRDFLQGIVSWIANWIEAEQDQERQVTSLAR